MKLYTERDTEGFEEDIHITLMESEFISLTRLSSQIHEFYREYRPNNNLTCEHTSYVKIKLGYVKSLFNSLLQLPSYLYRHLSMISIVEFDSFYG